MASGFSPEASGRHIHPLVYFDYRLRVIADLVAAATIASILYERRAGGIAWTAFVANGVLWPHVAFLIARRARDSKRAELRNVLFDGLFAACWMVYIGFTPLPTTMLMCTLAMAFLSTGGLRFTLAGLAVVAAGLIVVGALLGFRFEPDVSLRTTALSGFGLLLFMGAAGLASNRQVRHIIQSNKTIEAQNREIEAKTVALEAASRHKSEFLANMSHELRTPLNAVLGFSEVLLERMFGDVNAKQEEYLTDIAASGRHLLSLVNDILDLSKIEAGRMELELAEFDLPQTIDNTLMLVRERAGSRGVALEQTVDGRLPCIRGDERKIRQVLLNLLSNALKFTPAGGRIEVRAGVVDGTAEVSVTDTGVGIALEDQATVFEEFRQVGTAEKKAEGTGLGLALSRKFVELHGGRIWVTSQPGVGSTFAFTLPLPS
jgi:signal transduction histidine kinase